MAPLKTEAELQHLLQSQLPAVKTAGCRFSPVAGLSGESWRISGEGVQLLARRERAANTAFGVNRRREANVLRRCGSGLGPRVMAQNHRWLVVEWLSGDVVTEAQFAQMADNGRLAAGIAQLHHRPLSGYRLNLQQQFSRYWQFVDRRRVTPAWLRLQQRFLHARPPRPLHLAPLHMDIHPGNLVLDGERLRLIDWEYAADGDIALELAALFYGNRWSPERQQRFLQHYAHGYPPAQLRQQIRRWQPWVEYLMLLWFEVRWQQSGDRAFLHWSAAQRQRFCLS